MYIWGRPRREEDWEAMAESLVSAIPKKNEEPLNTMSIWLRADAPKFTYNAFKNVLRDLEDGEWLLMIDRGRGRFYKWLT